MHNQVNVMLPWALQSMYGSAMGHPHSPYAPPPLYPHFQLSAAQV